MVDIDFVINITTGQTIISKDKPTPIVVPLVDGDTARLKVQLVKEAASGFGRVTVISAVGLPCQVGLSPARGTVPITSATAADAASAADIWTVDLPLNIAAVSALATAAGTDAWIEVLVGVQRFAVKIKLFKQILTAATQDPAADDVALGKKEFAAIGVTKNGEAGAFQIFTSPNGTKLKFYAGDDKEMHWEEIT